MHCTALTTLRLAGAIGTLAFSAEAAAPEIVSPAPGSTLNGLTEMGI